MTAGRPSHRRRRARAIWGRVGPASCPSWMRLVGSCAMHASMISVIMVVALAVSAQPAEGAGVSGASVATIVVPTGLDDDDVKRLHARVNAQVAAAGGTPMALSRAL